MKPKYEQLADINVGLNKAIKEQALAPLHLLIERGDSLFKAIDAVEYSPSLFSICLAVQNDYNRLRKDAKAIIDGK
jgi:hypothetical protein